MGIRSNERINKKIGEYDQNERTRQNFRKRMRPNMQKLSTKELKVMVIKMLRKIRRN